MTWLTTTLRGAAVAAVLVLGLVLGAAPALAVTVERVTSPGGVEAWLVQDHSIPIIAVSLAFRGGSALDPRDKAGLAEMVSSLLDEGAGELDSQAFQQRLADLSISLSFDGYKDTFRGGLRTLTRNRDQAFELLRLALGEPRFDTEPVERIRSQIQTIIARRANDPDYLVGRVFWTNIFGDHPYAMPRRGTEETVAAITIDDLRNFADQRFARDNLMLGVVGDITADELATLLDATFGTLPATSQPFSIPEAEIETKAEVIVVERDVPQSTITFGHKGLKRDDPDYYTAYIVNYILGGGGFSSRLYQKVREERGLAYSIGAYLSLWDHAGMVVGSVGTANERVGESLDVIRSEWARMRDGDVSEQELADAKTYVTGSYPLRLSSTRSIARILVAIQLEDLGIDYLDRRNSYIEAVTLDGVRRVARRLLDPDKLSVVIVGRPEGVEATRVIN